jgi:hypothetical protein
LRGIEGRCASFHQAKGRSRDLTPGLWLVFLSCICITFSHLFGVFIVCAKFHSGIMGSKGAGKDGSSGRNWIMGTQAFEARMPHHDGIKALWETKWKFPVGLALNFCTPKS